eukprot:TRINITY_DN1001_c1_g2_i1.p1 TRINITY_DN1001_c1_g2~~TRINITY_DN1001_c1_g2_i1.p1  ORF type:complete len:1220 (+),score=312.57 TRINITY_DN1001_c1_g2_i1:100-3759(+)
MAAKITFSAEIIDAIELEFGKKAQRVKDNTSSPVKLRAAERDLLGVAAQARDTLNVGVKGDKDTLRAVFGGAGIQRFNRMRALMDTIVLSDMHAKDPRWWGLKDQMDIVEEVLKQLGLFKMWDTSKPPTAVVYKGFPKRIVPGQKISFIPETDGGDCTSFTCEPALPEGLVFDEQTGSITGIVPLDIEAPAQKYRVTASNTAGSTGFDLYFAVSHPPTAVSLSTDAFKDLVVGQAVNFRPEVTSGKVKSWSISPPLPKGLALDGQTGEIVGSCQEHAPEKDYVLTAHSSKDVTNTIRFGVARAPPKSLSYRGLQKEYRPGTVLHLAPDVAFKTGAAPGAAALASKKSASNWGRAKKAVMAAIAPDLPKQVMLLLSGLEYSVSPPLPKGLTLIPKTGIITGRVAEAVPEQTYIVTATDGNGKEKVTAELVFGVKSQAPVGLRYPGSENPLHSGVYVSLKPEFEAGSAESFSVSPALPEGLNLADSGVLSGVPQTVGASTHKITAKNSEGEAAVEIKLEVKRAPPTGLRYPSSKAVHPLQKPVTGLAPKYEGGQATFSVAPALPTGMVLNETTGEITGTPTEEKPAAAYRITAKNESGETTSTLEFGVKLLPPADVRYPGIDDIYHYAEQVNLVPEVDGGATMWEVAPEFPKLLTIDPKTGVISGKPMQTCEEASYVVTASNTAGGTSVVLTFKITAPPPEGLKYPADGNDLNVGRQVALEPEIASGICASFSVDPPLPKGLVLDPKTGAISGKPEETIEKKKYKITATNIAGSTDAFLEFAVEELPEPTEEELVAQFAEELESITDLANLPPEPPRNGAAWHWMLWMVHRVWLNDPTLEVLNFSGLLMPLGSLEPRIAPKLMKGLGHNTYLTHLELANSNMQMTEGEALGESLRTNQTLRVLNVESNFLDQGALQHVLDALRIAKDTTAVEQLRISNQSGGNSFGRAFEEAIAGMLEVNQTIVKLSFVPADAHWRYKIDKAITRNCDIARRKRKQGGDKMVAEEKEMKKVRLAAEPTQAVWEVFPDDDEKLKVCRQCVVNSGRLPNGSELQGFARGKNLSLKYNEVAPLLKDFTDKLVKSMIGAEVEVTGEDATKKIVGALRAAEEKNKSWTLEVATASALYRFTSKGNVVFEVGDAILTWLKPQQDEAEAIKKQFRDADIDGDGFISREELGIVMRDGGNWTEAELDDLFASVDKDGNNLINYEEFVDWIVGGGSLTKK